MKIFKQGSLWGLHHHGPGSLLKFSHLFHWLNFNCFHFVFIYQGFISWWTPCDLWNLGPNLNQTQTQAGLHVAHLRCWPWRNLASTISSTSTSWTRRHQRPWCHSSRIPGPNAENPPGSALVEAWRLLKINFVDLQLFESYLLVNGWPMPINQYLMNS